MTVFDRMLLIALLLAGGANLARAFEEQPFARAGLAAFSVLTAWQMLSRRYGKR